MEGNWNDHSGEILSSKDGIKVIDCKNCGFAHIIPLPAMNDKQEFYENTFYDTYSADYIKKHKEDMEWWAIEHREKYNQFEKLLERQGSPFSLLDIGSGPGYFLKVGDSLGWKVTGVEPGLSAWEHSSKTLGLNVFNAYYSEENAKSFGLFDVVHLNNVLEHVVNARNVIELAAKNLTENGILSITSPNDFNPLQKIAVDQLGKEQWWVVPEQHINYFNKTSLESLVMACGFTITYSTASFPIELFLLMGDDYIGDHLLGREIHKKRKSLELHFEKNNNTDLKRRLYDEVAKIGLGRQITIMARKNSAAKKDH